MRLKHDPAVQAGARHLTAIHKDMAARGLLKPCKHIQNGGFSAARMANNADKLSAMQLEVDVVKNGQIF